MISFFYRACASVLQSQFAIKIAPNSIVPFSSQAFYNDLYLAAYTYHLLLIVDFPKKKFVQNEKLRWIFFFPSTVPCCSSRFILFVFSQQLVQKYLIKYSFVWSFCCSFRTEYHRIGCKHSLATYIHTYVLDSRIGIVKTPLLLRILFVIVESLFCLRLSWLDFMAK